MTASTPEQAPPRPPEIGADRGFDSAEELIASAAMDVVQVCTPNNLHLPLALAAIAAGKHIIVEKPVALDAAGAASLAEAADDTGLIATVPFAYRYYPPFARRRPAPGRASATCACSTAGTCRIGCSEPTTTTGASRPRPAGRPGRSPTSARTGAT